MPRNERGHRWVTPFSRAGHLWATNTLGYHGNEAYAPRPDMDEKNFLRPHIDAAGALTLYPIGVDRVRRKWRFRPDGRRTSRGWCRPTARAGPIRSSRLWCSHPPIGHRAPW